MRARTQGTGSAREKIAEMSGIISGREISGRCYAITDARGVTRHEIEVQSDDEVGIADVPRGAAPEPLLWRAMELFADTLQFRQ